MINPIRHGEVIFKAVAELPKGAVLLKEAKKEIVAHSETGHHHVLRSTKPFKVYTLQGETYVEVPELAELWHQKTGKDTHAPHKVIPAVYKVVTKKHFDYFKGALESVRD